MHQDQTNEWARAAVRAMLCRIATAIACDAAGALEAAQRLRGLSW